MVMVNKNEKCVLCTRTVSKCDYVLFEGIHREILDVLLINIHSKKTVKSVICNDCVKNVEESFAFKSSCLYTEDNITPFIESQTPNGEKLDLSQILQSTKDIEKSMLQNKQICRFCMKIIEKMTFTPLTDISGSTMKLLENYFPELHLDATTDPIICEICLSCLKDYSNFVKSCKLVVEKDCTRISSSTDKALTKQNKGKSGNTTKMRRKKINLTHYKCDKCEFKTLHNASLYTHGLVHKDIADIKMYKCDSCPYQTKYKQGIAKHKETHLLDKSSLKKHKCPHCSHSTREAGSLKSHMLCHESSSKVPLFRCTHCPFKSKYKTSFVYHSLIHADVPPLKCPSCAFETKHKRIMDAHKLTHDKEKKFACSECDYKTNVKSYLVLHLRRHTERRLNKTFSCELCPYKTIRKALLVIHRSRHRDLSQGFKCDLCLFTSRYKNSVIRHAIVHEDASKIPMYKCDLCSHKTRNKYQLKVHRRNHDKGTVYKCEACEFTTKHLSCLKTHQLRKHSVASGQKMFECFECGFRAKEKLILRNHMVIHSDVFYDCSLCDYQTKHKRNMSSHYKHMHNRKNLKIVVQ